MQLVLLCSGVGEEDTEPFLGVLTKIQPTTAVKTVFNGFAEVILRGCKKCTVRPQSRTSQPTGVHQMLHKKSENDKKSELLLL